MNTQSLGSPTRFPSSPLSFTTLINVGFLYLFLNFHCALRSDMPLTHFVVASKLYLAFSGAFSSGDFARVSGLNLLAYQYHYQCLPDQTKLDSCSRCQATLSALTLSALSAL